jgi:hypothetical protein
MHISTTTRVCDCHTHAHTHTQQAQTELPRALALTMGKSSLDSLRGATVNKALAFAASRPPYTCCCSLDSLRCGAARRILKLATGARAREHTSTRTLPHHERAVGGFVNRPGLDVVAVCLRVWP